MTACKATTKTGAPCRMKPTASGFCFAHDPDREADRIAARRLGGQHRRRVDVTDLPESVQLRSLDDLLGVLEATVADTRALEGGVQRSKALGYLVAQALRVIETSHLDEIEARLSALERGAGIQHETRSQHYPPTGTA